MTPDALDNLLDKYMDGALSDAEREALQSELRSNSEAQQRFWESAQFHASLRSLACAEPGRELSVAAAKRRGARARRHFRSLRRNALSWAALAAAASVAIAVGILFFARPDERAVTPPAVIAHLIEANGPVQIARDSKVLEARSGSELLNDDQLQLFEEACARLQYKGEPTFVEVSGPARACIYQEQGAKRIKLDAGRLVCDVARQEVGASLRILTPHGKATVLGTVFSLSVTSAKSRLEVTNGTVELADGQSAVTVGAGEWAEAGPGITLEVHPSTPKREYRTLSFKAPDDVTLPPDSIESTPLLKAGPGSRHRILIRFPVRGTKGAVAKAVLLLTVAPDTERPAGRTASGTLRVHLASHANWSQSEFQKRPRQLKMIPEAVRELDAIKGRFRIGDTIELDVSQAVDKDGDYSFILTMDPGDDAVWFLARDQEDEPELRLSVE